MTLPVWRPVLIVLPKRDFDPSEVAVTWKVLGDAGHSVIFATPDGLPAAADPLMLSGEELDVWGRVPVLRKIKVLGLALRANTTRGARMHRCKPARRSVRPSPIRRCASISTTG
jgi:hypothetical protein